MGFPLKAHGVHPRQLSLSLTWFWSLSLQVARWAVWVRLPPQWQIWEEAEVGLWSVTAHSVLINDGFLRRSNQRCGPCVVRGPTGPT